MALDINDTIENGDAYQQQHLVYREGTSVRFPDKAADIFLGILPALADPEDMTSYSPYRDSDTGKFTNWVTAGYYYPFVNREKSILSPKTLDSGAMDPIDELIKSARSHPKFNVLAGFGPDGKKIKDAWKNPECRIPSRTLIFVVNAITLYNRDFPSDQVHLMQIPSTAFKGQGGEDKKGTWGLVGQLNMRNRGSSEDDDFDTKYYWGDITDPHKIVPVKLSQEKPPTGSSFKIYNLVPEDQDTVKIGKSVLSKRYNLDNIFYEITESEILDYLVYSFIDVPELLRIAFATKVPGFDKLLKAATAKRSFAPADAEEEEEEIALPARKKAKAEDDDLPPFSVPTKKKEAVLEEEDEIDVAPVKRSFAPKVEPLEEEEEEVVKKPARKATAAKAEKKPASSLRDLIDEEE